MYVRDALAEGAIERLDAPPLEESFVIQAAWRKTGALSPAAREFLAILEEDARSWR
jgi:DNA-binding transcriptional LysR family regulator